MELTFSDPNKHNAGVLSLIAAKRIFEELNVDFWISNGTLLGCVRGKDLIPHDSDIDFGLWIDTPDHDRIKNKFIQKGFKLLTEFGSSSDAHQFAFNTPFDVYMDVFFYTKQDNKCWMPLWAGGKYRKMVFPLIPELTTLDLFGEKFPVPSNYQEMLTANYGDWKIPVSNWSWCDSPKNFEES